jgi:hypothetical protein
VSEHLTERSLSPVRMEGPRCIKTFYRGGPPCLLSYGHEGPHRQELQGGVVDAGFPDLASPSHVEVTELEQGAERLGRAFGMTVYLAIAILSGVALAVALIRPDVGTIVVAIVTLLGLGLCAATLDGMTQDHDLPL